MARNSLALSRLRRAAIDSLEARQMLAATEYITNGNFSSNGANWTLTGDFHADAAVSTTDGLSNPGYAYLSAADGATADSNNLAGTISQTIAMPATVNSAKLTYWYRTTTEETGGSNDTVNIKIKNATSGTTLATIATIYNTTMNSYVQAGPFDLSSYAGQTIAISFDGTTNATGGTVFRVDNVSLQIDVPSASAAVAAPTEVSPGVTTTTGLPSVNSPMPTLRWDPVSNAAGYGVVIQKQTAGTTTYTTVFNSEASTFASPIKGTTFSSPTPLAAGSYRWQVRAFDSSGAPTSYAPSLYFNVVTSGYNRAVGIDISNFQTVTSWATVKTNGTTGTTDDTTFVYAKATEGFTYNDPQFASFVTGARGAGIALGGYHFARPENNSAASEAQHFASVLSADGALSPGTNLAPMLDFEDTNSAAVALGKTALTKWLNDFGDAFIGLTGIVPIVYTFVSYATSYIDSSALRYPLWQAQYPTTAANPTIPIASGAPSGTSPWPSGGWVMWQYTDNRSVGGIAANTDGDVSNSDAATFLDAYKIPSATTYAVGGTIYEDSNSNGVKDSGEAGISGRTVFLDADGDGVLDNGEKTAVTNSSGVYSFGGLLQGNYQVRQLVPNGSVSTTAAVQAFKLGSGIASIPHDFGSRTLDVTPPVLASSRFNYDHADQSITLVFSEDVGASIATSDVVLTNITTGATAPVTLTYNAATLTATVTPTSTLANGDYQLVIAAGNISDAAGNPNAEIDVSFFSLAGDANRDRSVGFDDLVIVAQNYGLTTGATYAQGDFNGDGAVNFDDLVLVAQNYGQSLGSMIVAIKAASTSNVASITPGAAKSVAATNKKKPSQDVLA